MDSKLYKFDSFCLDPKQRKLLSENKVVQLSSRAFEMLLLLVQKQGEVVEKSEILDKVWSDSFVEESNLVVHISALRRVLGETRGERKFIETVSGRGYSFVFPIEEAESNRKPAKLKTDETFTSNVEKTAPGNSDSLAVLPLVNKSGNTDFEYLADGITQSLIANLSQIPSLKVMAYNAVEPYKNSAQDYSEIGFLLGVENILLGSITEFKNYFEISVELVKAQNKQLIWGTHYNCEFTDIFKVRKEISLIIAEKLQIRLNNLDKSNLARQQTSDSDAYRFYTKGMYLLGSNSTSKFREESLHSALKCFRQALKKDPNYALAYTGIGYAYYRLLNINAVSRGKAYQECKTALQLALNFDAQLSDALILDGIIKHFFERNPRDAERSFDRAIESNPNNPIAFHYKSLLLCCFEKHRESLFYQNKAIQLDPISIFLHNGLSRRFFLGGDYNKAIIQAEETLELDNELVAPYFILALSYAQLGLFDEALENIEKTLKIQPTEEMFLAQSYIYALAGETAQATAILRTVLDKSSKEQIDFTDAAIVYAALRENDKAFEYLDKAFKKGDTNILLLRTDPRFEDLHSDSRFVPLLRKLNLE
ncbi:MAG TPA: winged helix-turn-helix domain-containing protein [Pyrinomonadaceae bacterium]|nr:winged helix-turn-helix domain-containing protein [Pyrinomonadaceae bacterium]